MPEEPTRADALSAADGGAVAPAKKTVQRRRKPAAPRAKKTASRGTVNAKAAEAIERELTAIYQEPDGTIPNMKKIDQRRTSRAGSFFVGLLVIGVLGAGLLWVRFLLSGGGADLSNSAAMAIEGPETVAVGATTTYVFSYSNTTNRSLDEATLNIYPPAGFITLQSSLPAGNAGKNEWHLGSIQPRGKGTLTLTGLPYGDVGSSSTWRVILRYRPDKFNSTLEQTAARALRLTPGAVAVTVGGPSETSVGADTVFNFTIKNTDELKNGRAELVPQFGGAFVVSSSTPALQNNRWQIGRETKSSSTTATAIYKITGKFTAPAPGGAFVLATISWTPPKQTTAFRVAESRLPLAVGESAVSAQLAINGNTSRFSVKPGDILTISARVKNSSLNEIKNGSIKLTLDAPAVKKQSLLSWADIADPLDGTIIGEQVSDAVRRGTITWTAKELPALAKLKPGAESTVDLRLPLRSGEHFDLSALTTSTITGAIEIKYTDKTGAEKTAASVPLVITVNSDLGFEARSERRVEGGKKKYSITWVLSNSFHALKNVEVSATHYGDSVFADASSSIGSVEYKPKEKTITWRISNWPLDVDVATLPFNLTLSSENPTQTALLSKVRVRGSDTVTGEQLEITGEELLLAAN